MTDDGRRTTDRVYWIEHKGARILYYDWTNVLDNAEAVALARVSAEAMRKEPLNSVLVLTNVAGSRFNKKVLDAILGVMVGNKPYVKASALTGMSGVMLAAYGAMGKLTGRKLQATNTVDEAKDWLAAQQ